MKAGISKILKALEQGAISEERARSLLLGLLGVTSLQPLTIKNVSKMLDKVSKETWIAAGGDESGWGEWWKSRNTLHLNSNPVSMSDVGEPL